MRLQKLQLKNFKSFKDISIEFNEFNLLIGGCASGKSNFIEIFKFLQDMANDFEKAIYKHGGDYYFKNLNLPHEECYLKTSFIKNGNPRFIVPIRNREKLKENEIIIMDFEEIDYELKFKFDNFGSYNVLDENIIFHCDFYKVTNEYESETDMFNIDDDHQILKTDLCIKNSDGKITVDLKDSLGYIEKDKLIPEFLVEKAEYEFKRGKKLMINSSISILPITWSSLFDNFKFYDFHPKLCKSISSLAEEPTLNEHGDNLPIILDDILKNDEEKRKFLNLIKSVLPYVDNIDVEEIMENHRIFNLSENYNDASIPAPLISDGTSDIIALIVALFFEKGDVIFIEEPERNIHPDLLSDIVDLMEESAIAKQIVITTHSPEVLRNSELKNIFLISRNSSGFSEISKPIDNKILRPFIEDLGISEVYIDDYLKLNNE